MSEQDLYEAVFEGVAETYGSDHNCEKARELGVDVVSPCMGSPSNGSCSLGDFTFSRDGKPVACPRGQVTLKTKKKKNRFSAVFDSETCAACPFTGDCPVKAGRRGHYLRYDEKAMRLAGRRTIENTPEFIEKYRFRAGVEGTMSQFDRRTGVKHLRVRGLKAVRLCAFLKATGINLFKTAAFKRGKKGGDSPPRDLSSSLYVLFQLVKERLTSNSVFGVRQFVKNSLAFQF